MSMLSIRGYKNANLLNNQGFTMLEMLFSFSIFCLITSLLPILFQILFTENSIEGRIQRMEWELFVSQLKKEVQASDFVDVVNGKLTLRRGGQIITFEPYQTVLRRRVDGKGHEVVLQNVEMVSFNKDSSELRVEVKDIYQEKNEASIHTWVFFPSDDAIGETNE